MRTRTFAAALAAALTLAACGGGDDTTDAAAPDAEAAGATETKAPEPALLDEAQLQQGLVTLQDLPTGYAADAETEDDDTEIQGETPECTKTFNELDDQDDDAQASAQVDFTNEQNGFSSLQHTWESYEDADQLQKDLEELKEVFRTCDTMILPLDDPDSTRLELQLKETSFPQLGDASAAYSASGEVEVQGIPFTFSLLFVFVRDGNNGMSVFQGGLGQADIALVEKVARLGVERLPAAS